MQHAIDENEHKEDITKEKTEPGIVSTFLPKRIFGRSQMDIPDNRIKMNDKNAEIR